MNARDATRRCGGFTCRVVADHQASFPDALVFKCGEVLSLEDRETVWDGWVWCTNKLGIGAWVPEGFVERCGDRCTTLRDYDSTELSVRAGDILEAREEANGWLWCTDRKGGRGWVPAVCVKPHAET
jgi:hypothetical protein